MLSPQDAKARSKGCLGWLAKLERLAHNETSPYCVDRPLAWSQTAIPGSNRIRGDRIKQPGMVNIVFALHSHDAGRNFNATIVFTRFSS